MKKYIFLAITIVSFSTFSSGQLEIIQPGDKNVLNDSTITVYGNADVQLVPVLYVINAGNSSENVYARQDYVSVLANNVNAICWAGFCYANFADVSQFSESIGSHDTSTAEPFNGHYTANGMGTSTIRYTFYNASNHADSSWVLVNYITSNLGVSNVSAEKIGLSTYPNPAKTSVSFNYNLSANTSANLKMFNLLGECVQTLPLNTSKSKTTVDVQSLPSGIYICEIVAEGYQPAFQKLVVSHQ